MSTELSQRAEDALRSALRAEQAAIWASGLTRAYATEQRVSSAISEAANTHRARRDAAERLLRDAGATPPPAAPAYRFPGEVNDQRTAIRLLITAEEDCATGWRSALESSEEARIRRTALEGLTAAATRATRWRITIDEQPAARAFPGEPEKR